MRNDIYITLKDKRADPPPVIPFPNHNQESGNNEVGYSFKYIVHMLLITFAHKAEAQEFIKRKHNIPVEFYFPGIYKTVICYFRSNNITG